MVRLSLYIRASFVARFGVAKTAARVLMGEYNQELTYQMMGLNIL
ncbi:hypothetical protein RS130_06230 [Paraglaciecola aquimarina]|uniref:Transposase n=1 Tax=Paraglaciecola aquimarina TaxID=1235557 RepID=A0ABU3SU95_9ALTE|nr:hypothetical protein [Paraglaciecola aquimarina]MDU0353580.1 hypothetical protein [Paraglaciecola aquimarina]